MDWSVWPSIWGFLVYTARVTYNYIIPSAFDLDKPAQLRQAGVDLYFMGVAIWGIILVRGNCMLGSRFEPRIIIAFSIAVGGAIIIHFKKKEDVLFIQEKKKEAIEPKSKIKRRSIWALVIHLLGALAFLSATFFLRNMA